MSLAPWATIVQLREPVASSFPFSSSSSREEAPLEVCPCEKTVKHQRYQVEENQKASSLGIALSAFINKSNFHGVYDHFLRLKHR